MRSPGKTAGTIPITPSGRLTGMHTGGVGGVGMVTVGCTRLQMERVVQ